MTIEQEIQATVKAAFLDAVDAYSTLIVHAVKLDNDEDATDDAEAYPAIVIDTSTPVPMGHKSAIAEVPLFVRCLAYMPDDRKSGELAELAELAFRVIHRTDDWTEFQSQDPPCHITAILITSSEQPVVIGGSMVMEQSTQCTVAICIRDENEEY